MINKKDGISVMASKNSFGGVLAKILGVDRLIRLLKYRSYARSLWAYSMVSGCCLNEFTTSCGPKYKTIKNGHFSLVSSPRHADLLIVSGTVNNKQAKVIKNIYEQMGWPKWVMAIGVCACSGGIFQTKNEVFGVEQVLPVDIFVHGCPPTPEAIIEGFSKFKRKEQLGAIQSG